MVVGILGVAAACFAALTARKMGLDVTRGSADLGLAALGFVLGMVAPGFAAIDGEPGFVIFGSILSATAAFMLFRGVMKMLAPD